jgi:hypothetical protein
VLGSVVFFVGEVAPRCSRSTTGGAKWKVDGRSRSMAGAECRLSTPDGPVGGASSELPLPTGDNRCLVVRAAVVELPGRGVTGE